MTDRAPASPRLNGDATAADDNNNDTFDLAISEDLVQSPAHQAAATSTLDFDGLLQPAETALKLHQDLANGNGGKAWPAGVVLAKYLLRRKRDELRGASMSVRPRAFRLFSGLCSGRGGLTFGV